MAIRAALDDGGFEDMPSNGSFVVSAIGRTGAPLSAVVASLGVSKQAGSQLVDTLANRGYIRREPDPADGRRLRVILTPRGEAAAAVVRAAIDRVDVRLLAEVGPEAVTAARRALGALAVMPAAASQAAPGEHSEGGEGHRR